jgi:hypothetical protein
MSGSSGVPRGYPLRPCYRAGGTPADLCGVTKAGRGLVFPREPAART